jgi:hypothetical protein
MSSRYINADLRDLVAIRANFVCEYCLVSEEDTYFSCQVEHIISLKHGGSSEPGNLAYACTYCNRFKGSDIGSITSKDKELIRFYNPRIDSWHEHFKLKGNYVEPLTDIGDVTSRILQFNNDDRLLERKSLIEQGRYPNDAAMLLINE